LEEIELQVNETLKRSLSDEDRERERTMIVEEVKKFSRGRRLEEEKDYDPVHSWASSFDDLLRDIEDSTLLSGHWSARVIKLLRKVMRYVTNKKTYAAIKRLIGRMAPIFTQMSVSIRTRFKKLMEKRVVPEDQDL
jgi:spore cortex formation protein SpoVR/YcgB (stage V sporulation)